MLETGKNSVMPSTMPRMTACSQFTDENLSIGGRADAAGANPRHCIRAHTIDGDTDNSAVQVPGRLTSMTVVGAETSQLRPRSSCAQLPHSGGHELQQHGPTRIVMSCGRTPYDMTSFSVLGGIHIARAELGVQPKQAWAVVPDELDPTDDLADGRLLLDLLVNEPVEQRNGVDVAG